MEIKRCLNCMEELSENNGICPACGADNRKIEQPNYALQPGAMLHGRYFVGKVLGQGGFGITYIGLDLLFNVKVAIKEYFPMGVVTRDSGGSSKILWNTSQASQTQRQGGYDSFLKEARKMAKIDQIPSIVRVRDLFLENETAYIVMDYVEGVTLKQKLQQTGPIAFSDCIALLRPMLEDLAKVHREGMIHRDISPDNIMIQPDGSVRLLDLGAAKDMTTAHGVSSQVVAKKGFSPLEQYKSKGEVGPWTDVYALCATIYYCITGKLLPDAFDRIEEEEEINFPENLKEPLSEENKEALRAGLEVRVKKRTQGVEELLRQLDAGEIGEMAAEGTRQEGEEERDKAEGDIVSEQEERDRQKQEEDSELKKEEGEDKVEEAEGERERQEANADLGQDEGLEQVSADKGGALSKLSKVKKGVWAALAGCLLVVAAFIYTLSSSQSEESSEPITKIEEENKKDEVDESPEAVEDRKMDVSKESVLGESEKQNEESEPKEEQKVLPVMASRIVFRNKYVGSDICKITFVDTLKGKSEDAWDVSLNHDESVMAWMSPSKNGRYELFVGGEGKIQASVCESLFYGFTNVEEINFNGCFDTSQVTDMESMFSGCESLKNLDVSKFDTNQVTDMRSMFSGCSNLSELDVRNFDTSQVTDMGDMFGGCEKLSKLDVSKFDTSQVTDMGSMFSLCRNLKQLDVSKFDTSRVTDMGSMFFVCRNLKQLDVSKFDTSQVTDMGSMFDSCEKLSKLDVGNFDTSWVTDMGNMFGGCEKLSKLDVGNFDTSRVTDMCGMFSSCEKLNKLDVSNFNTSQVTRMNYMFQGCENLSELDLKNFDTSQVTKMRKMFYKCKNLSELDLSSFDMSKVTNDYEGDGDMFTDCPAKVTGL